jgi:hypothetical protein
MGADFIGVVIPACQITDKRQAELEKVVAGLNEEEIEWDSPFLEEGEVEEGELDKAKVKIRDAIKFYKECEEREDVGRFKIRGVYYYITGGLSWGDLPTTAFAPLEFLVVHEKINDALEKWAAEDCQ